MCWSVVAGWHVRAGRHLCGDGGDVVAGQIINMGTADSDQTDPVTDGETVTVPTPGLVVDKVLTSNADEDGSGDVSVGDTLTYTITATNTGTANLTDVVVSDDLTGDSTTRALVGVGRHVRAGRHLCGDAGDVTAGSIVNIGTADSDQLEPVTDGETVTVPTPGLVVDKVLTSNADEDGSGDVSIGDTLTYTMTATNTGTANLTDVVVSDDSDRRLDHVCWSGCAGWHVRAGDVPMW